MVSALLKTIRPVLFFTLFLVYRPAFAQNCPPNIDFEKGDFSGWQCFTGITTTDTGGNRILLNPSSPIPGRHEILTTSSSAVRDRYGNFPVLCPYGGKYSVKLGNDFTNSEAEGLSYTFTVPATVDTFTFTYFYAVVFEDPAHLLPEQPRFFVTAYDVVSGDVINCASYDYVSNGGIPGFEKSPINPGVLYKNWTPTSLQFAGLGGRKVRLEFKTADCTLGGHFGYAYIDVGSACSNILATAPYCRETNSLILNAPYGFKNYTWYNQDFTKIVGHNQSLTLSPPPAISGEFKVDVEPYPGYGCRDTLQAVVTPLPVPDTPSVRNFRFCQYSYPYPLEATAAAGNELVWYAGDTTVAGSILAPVPSTSTPGSYFYYVAQKVLFGCESFRKKISVTIVPYPLASFRCNAARQCENGNRFVFTSTSSNLENALFHWDFGDGSSQSAAGDSVVTHTYATGGNYYVRLRVENAGACTSEQTMYVTVIPKPIARFDYPPVVCQHQTILTVRDQSEVPGGMGSIDRWWWDFDGMVLTSQHPDSFLPDKAGVLSVKMVATTTEGCHSDTAVAAIPVHPQPPADFRHSAPLCDKEIIRFTDQSAMPPGGDVIVKWDWQFANHAAAEQHPSRYLSPGTHTINLTTETNFGCRSRQKDTVLTIYAKPDIRLRISDSCVFRTIEYTASDLQNSVAKWYWDLGNGFYEDKERIIRSYTTASPRPLTVIGETAEGCRDTLLRAFSIYDNRAFAGRDTLTAMNEPVQLNANGGPDISYVWTPAAGLSDARIENPVAVLDRDQLYRLDAITKEGCDSHSAILIKRYKGPELYIPNAFTPNGDGKNDVLKVLPVGIRTFHYLAVYNRYGQQLFRTTDYSTGWNGTYKGTRLGTGTYVFIAEAVDYKGRLLVRKGTVTLVR
jgi:gliding motility-associated-like protein